MARPPDAPGRGRRAVRKQIGCVHSTTKMRTAEVAFNSDNPDRRQLQIAPGITAADRPGSVDRAHNAGLIEPWKRSCPSQVDRGTLVSGYSRAPAPPVKPVADD